MRRIRLFFLSPVDALNTNAQSLNTREVVLRLDPQRFEITLVYEQKPDPRLLNLEHVKLIRLPARLKTFCLLRAMLSGYDILAYMDYSPASYMFVHLPRAMRRRTKTVHHAEGPANLEDDEPAMLKFLYRGVVSKCDVYTAITDWVAHDYATILRRHADYILPVGVSNEFFASAPVALNRNTAVLFVGTLVKRKEPLHIIDAAARFAKVHFRMIGADRDGYGKLIENKIAELGLRNVILEGGKSQVQIAQAMRESDIFILPSRLEGLPKVTLEAAASGLPCIVYRDYETPSVVDGVTGFQVSTQEEMMNKLGLLIADPLLRKRMGIAARQHAGRFDWNEIAGRWERAYLDIAAGAKAAGATST
jgi:glycosyltransferase involved in cell wall biosynthesis